MKQFRNQEKIHRPVLLREVVKSFDLDTAHLKRQVRIIDATLGSGGHSESLIKAGANVLGIEFDEEILQVAKRHLLKACPSRLSRKAGRFKLVKGNFKDIDKIAKAEDFEGVNGILFDLGISSYHFASIKRGFSFREDWAPLDMRIDPNSQNVSASDLLYLLTGQQLIKLFGETMAEVEAKKLTREVVSKRKGKKIRNVGDFLDITQKVLKKRSKLHPATKAFLALRIAVNSELDNLRKALPKAFKLLKPAGKLVVISFHSGEDKIVKKFFQETKKAGQGVIVTRKPVTPDEEEIRYNPRARSAKMRVLQKK